MPTPPAPTSPPAAPTSSPLSANEAAVLRAAGAATGCTSAELAAKAGLREEQAQSACEALVVRGSFEREETVTARLVITDVGRAQAKEQVPELRIRARIQGGASTVQAAQELPGLDKGVIGSAFGALKKAGLITVGATVGVADAPGWATHEARQRLLEALAGAPDGLTWPDDVDAALRPDVEARAPGKRGKKGGEPFEIAETRVRAYRLTAAGVAAQAALATARREEVQLTAQMLKDGSWRDVTFRQFNVGAPAWVPLAKRDAYRAFLDQVKQTLLGLGFEEMTGPLVEPELWNMDALFLPQFHPAREIHDVYYVDDQGGRAGSPGDGYVYAREIEHGADEAVAREHEGKGASGSRGWQYSFDRQRTKRLVLRSQGTALSARWLQKARSPGKYFAMARCFRYDEVDATHAPDFFQIEGIVRSSVTSFRHLLGLLELFAREVARSDAVKFVPAYFPFTEPSVEVHMRHPRRGWVELGGAGIFRPEVTRPHGIDDTVIAWGLGLDRMAMVALGIDDIRELFANNLPGGVAALRNR